MISGTDFERLYLSREYKCFAGYVNLMVKGLYEMRENDDILSNDEGLAEVLEDVYTKVIELRDRLNCRSTDLMFEGVGDRRMKTIGKEYDRYCRKNGLNSIIYEDEEE